MANQAQLEAKIDALKASVDQLAALVVGGRFQVETATERNASTTTTTTAALTTTTTAGE